MTIQAVFLLLIPLLGTALATIGYRLATSVGDAGSQNSESADWYFVVFFVAVGSVVLLGLLAIVVR